MKEPKIILKVDINADIKNCINFVQHNLKENLKYTKWFLPDNFLYILEEDKDKQNEIFEKCILEIYKNKKNFIMSNLKKAELEWKTVEKKYLDLVNKIFKNYPWPEGPYMGFASIFRMYPRNIEHKTFFFPGIIYSEEAPPAKTVIGHEVLHFMFFDYIEKKYNLKTDSQIKGREKDYLWKISEVFNFVIENWTPYYDIFKFKTLPYTGKEFFGKMKQQWTKHQDIDKLLDNWLVT